MNKKVKKWGNSFAIRIPKKEAEAIGLYENEEVEIERQEDCLVIKGKNRELKDLVNRITEENKHFLSFPEDKPKGKEAW